VTGADGFVGSWLVPRLLADRHVVVAGVRPSQPLFTAGAPAPWSGDVPVVPLEILDAVSIEAVLTRGFDAVVHLAAVSSGGDARRDPSEAWAINAGGTARLAEALLRQRETGSGDALLLLVSTPEVYGAQPEGPRVETDATEPCSPYAASKLAAETAALEASRRGGLRVVVARPFPHTGRGQDTRFVVPAFAHRLLEAKKSGATSVKVGNLTPVREFMHVSDVVSAYAALLEQGEPGQVYNVASGRGMKLSDIFGMLAAIVEHPAQPETDPELVRPADIQYLVGDSTKLRQRTGWEPKVTLEERPTFSIWWGTAPSSDSEPDGSRR
jgi:GDP-4-dehydro-6-deoxy-D-mannose reductase